MQASTVQLPVVNGSSQSEGERLDPTEVVSEVWTQCFMCCARSHCDAVSMSVSMSVSMKGAAAIC